MSRRILETRNYEKFIAHELNREVRTKSMKYKNLEKSLIKDGWNDCAPMVVWENGERLQIVRGHKRFHIARKHNLPVKYQIDNTKKPIHSWEREEDPWRGKDFLDSYVRKGTNKDYITLKNFRDETGIPLTPSIALLCRGRANGGPPESFFTGEFKVNHLDHASKVGDVIKYCTKLGIAVSKRTVFVRAISLIISSGKVSPSSLKAKLKNHSHRIGKKATTEEYLMLLEKVYNFKSSEKIPLAFLAQQELEKRETA